MSAASSAVALGRMPGSLKLVCSSVMTTNTKRAPPMTGMQPVRCLTRKGQLRKGQDATFTFKSPQQQLVSSDRQFRVTCGLDSYEQIMKGSSIFFENLTL